MTALEQFLYRSADGGRGPITPVASSCADRDRMASWQRQLDPWLRIGRPPARGYLVLGETGVLIRWMPGAPPGAPPGTPPGTLPGAAQDSVHVLAGPSSALTARLALRVPAWDWDRSTPLPRGRLAQVRSEELVKSAAVADFGAAARSALATELLVPLLAQILAGNEVATVSWAERCHPEWVLWGLLEILQALGDARSLSFITRGRSSYPALSGLLISFSPDITAEPTDPVYERAAVALVTSYADNGGPALRRELAAYRVLDPADGAARVRRLLELWPGSPARSRPAQDVTAETAAETADGDVSCPVCLSRLTWSKLARWRWDAEQGSYVELNLPAQATREQQARARRAAVVRCLDQDGTMGEHYLPAEYGSHGKPVLLGFVGATRSGKSHLLATMVDAIESGGLDAYGAQFRPVDHALHQRFVADRVKPLLKDARVLDATPEGAVSFVDAFLIRQPGGPERSVALFDVAGGELTSVADAKRFLELVDGLIFVVDPAQLGGGPGDETCNTVLALLQASDRLPHVSAAVVLDKADLLRFDDPVALWLRSDIRQIDAELILSESADVYAYLHSKGAQAWTRPYRECGKATLHVASATGGAAQDGVYPRGVTPRRVLAPLVALLAMTGVLTGPQAQKVGI